MALMEIYYQMESKENREDKNVQKYVGKSQSWEAL